MPEWLIDYLTQVSVKGFYGKVTLSYVDGKVADIRVERNYKPDDLK